MEYMPALTIDLQLRLADLREQSLPPVRPPLWFIKETAFKGDRVPFPAIVNLLAQPMDITREWQYFIRAINYNMEAERVSAIYGHQKAFCNGTGLGDPADPRADYVLGESTNEDPPQFDKCRTCVRSVVTGRKDDYYLWLETLNGNYPPPLKEGRWIDPLFEDWDVDDYLYTPQSHPWLFFACNNINAEGEVFPFDHGGYYSWFLNGTRQVTWLPLVSRFPVRLALEHLERLPDGAVIPSPYS